MSDELRQASAYEPAEGIAWRHVWCRKVMGSVPRGIRARNGAVKVRARRLRARNGQP
jgi:hypothetical protein